LIPLGLYPSAEESPANIWKFPEYDQVHPGEAISSAIGDVG
jgi:hypothetical protein